MNAGAVRQVGPEVFVRLEYALYDADGELIDAPGQEDELELIAGLGQAPAVIEQAIDGLTLGESRRIELAPHEAFGPHDEDAMVVVARSELPPDIELGDELEAEREDGETVLLRVVQLDGEQARLDANHPLAGQRIALELRVVELRVATPPEVEAARAALEADAAPSPDAAVSQLLRKERLPSPGER